MTADGQTGGREAGSGRASAGRQGALADVRAAIGESHDPCRVARTAAGDRGSESYVLARGRWVDRGYHRGARAGLVDGLGDGCRAARDEVRIAAISGGNGMAAYRQGVRTEGGSG